MRPGRSFPGSVVYTLDTHDAGYLSTQEGANLPVEHCVRDTEGWRVPTDLMDVLEARQACAFEKPTFGSVALGTALRDRHARTPISAIELVGLCTDICIVSNALLLKTMIPEVPLIVDAACCAGTAPDAHTAALRTMANCQVLIRQC